MESRMSLFVMYKPSLFEWRVFLEIPFRKEMANGIR